MYIHGPMTGLAPKPGFGSHQSAISTGQCVLTPPTGPPRAYNLDQRHMSDVQRRAEAGDRSRWLQRMGQLDPTTTTNRNYIDVQNIRQNALLQFMTGQGNSGSGQGQGGSMSPTIEYVNLQLYSYIM